MSGKLTEADPLPEQQSPDEDNLPHNNIFRNQSEHGLSITNPSLNINQHTSSTTAINKRLNLIIAILTMLVVVFLLIHRVMFQSQLAMDSEMLPQQRATGTTSLGQRVEEDSQMSEEMKEIHEELNGMEHQKDNGQNHKQQKKNRNSNFFFHSSDSVTNFKYNLYDFIIEKPYVEAPPQIKTIFDQMITRNPSKKSKPNSIFLPSQKAYFAYHLFLEPNNTDYKRAQYFYYDNKYKISQYGALEDQLSICIIAPGRNIVSDDKYKRFIRSIAQQNYTNFKVVYVDDLSTDQSPFVLKHYVKNQFPTLTDKLVVVENKQRVFALGNRNNAIRNQCSQNDIVLDVDADDALIGSLVLQFINTVYHNESVWQANSVFIYISPEKKEITTGPIDGIPQSLLKQNKYRGSGVWKSEELRSYRAKLFWKIDQNDFKDEKGKFYKWASDHFIQEPLTELSGYEHYRHFYEIMYYYDWNIDRKSIYRRRHYRDIAWTQRPYKPLNSLQDKAEKVRKFQISEKMRKQYDKNVEFGRKEAKKYGDPVPF